MTLFMKIIIAWLVLEVILKIILIGREKSDKEYTTGGALGALLINAIIIYGLLNWL